MRPTIRRIGVVVPARNEERSIGACLEALLAAARGASVAVEVVVVLDGCTDATAKVCRDFPVKTVMSTARSVGAARHAGAMSLLAGEVEPAAMWLANTDADTMVPRRWLLDQVVLADRGVDAVAGVVALAVPSPTRLHEAFVSHYLGRLGPGDSHQHVHGANLGVRASAYLEVGGFRPVRQHEDRQLLEALERRERLRVIRTSKICVETSARLSGRCNEGFASTLRALSLPSAADRGMERTVTSAPTS